MSFFDDVVAATAAVTLGLGHVDPSNGAVVAVVSGGNVAPEAFAKYITPV